MDTLSKFKEQLSKLPGRMELITLYLFKIFVTLVCTELKSRNIPKVVIENKIRKTDAKYYNGFYLSSGIRSDVTYQFFFSKNCIPVFKPNNDLIKADKFDLIIKEIIENYKSIYGCEKQLNYIFTIDVYSIYLAPTCFIHFLNPKDNGEFIDYEYFVIPRKDTVRISSRPLKQDTIILGKKYKIHYSWKNKIAAIGNFKGRYKKVGLWINYYENGNMSDSCDFIFYNSKLAQRRAYAGYETAARPSKSKHKRSAGKCKGDLKMWDYNGKLTHWNTYSDKGKLLIERKVIGREEKEYK